MEGSQRAQGIRKKLEKGKKRHEFQADHGFRKWFKTRCELSDIKSITIDIVFGFTDSIFVRIKETNDEIHELDKVPAFITRCKEILGINIELKNIFKNSLF